MATTRQLNVKLLGGSGSCRRNAIFDAPGVRLRSLPLVPNGLKVA